MPKIRGKNPSVAQRKIMQSAGVDPTKYLIEGISMVKAEEEFSTKRTSLSKYDEKIEEWRLIHRATGEIKTIYP